MAPHSSTLAWKILWTEEPGGLQSMRSLGVGHDGATSLHFSLSCLGEGNGNPLQCSCLENPRDGGAWWAAVYGVAQSRTRLKQLSSSSSSFVISSEIRKQVLQFYFLFQDCFGYSMSLEIPCEYQDGFSTLQKISLGFWQRLHQICQSLWVVLIS